MTALSDSGEHDLSANLDTDVLKSMLICSLSADTHMLTDSVTQFLAQHLMLIVPDLPCV